mmetsp:Transcript_18361/g.49362  ORF Transcript_18361/g.49362 Transcript_18361/m.49362 type:complete len:242 (+) Transcript_18361:668-1393(+)
MLLSCAHAARCLRGCTGQVQCLVSLFWRLCWATFWLPSFTKRCRMHRCQSRPLQVALLRSALFARFVIVVGQLFLVCQCLWVGFWLHLWLPTQVVWWNTSAGCQLRRPVLKSQTVAPKCPATSWSKTTLETQLLPWTGHTLCPRAWSWLLPWLPPRRFRRGREMHTVRSWKMWLNGRSPCSKRSWSGHRCLSLIALSLLISLVLLLPSHLWFSGGCEVLCQTIFDPVQCQVPNGCNVANFI